MKLNSKIGGFANFKIEAQLTMKSSSLERTLR